MSLCSVLSVEIQGWPARLDGFESRILGANSGKSNVMIDQVRRPVATLLPDLRECSQRFC